MRQRAFTLLELLVATVIMAILLASLYGIYGGATRLRERVWGDIESAVPVDEALRIVRTDLLSAVSPGNALAKPMLGQTTENEFRADTLDFGASTGTLVENVPWGDLQGVNYSLIDPESGNEDDGKDLARTLTRNILAQTVQTEAPQRLLHNVQALEFQYYDGTAWQDAWDSTAQENKLPPAVRMRIDFLEISGKPRRHPVELVCQMVCDNTTASTTTSSGSITQ